jgi:hypothetical protein
MSSSSSDQIKFQQNQWQNKQAQKSRINYQNKSQNIYFDDYDAHFENELEFEHDSSAYYDDDDYCENRSYDEILKTSMKSEDMQSSESDQDFSSAHFDEILDEELTEMIKSSQLTLKCRQCEMKFYSNNKLHKHLRANQHSQSQQKIESINNEQVANISIIISARDHRKQTEYAFREHQYAHVKESFDLNRDLYEFCVDSETFMSFVDRKFLTKSTSKSDERVSNQKCETLNQKHMILQSIVYSICTFTITQRMNQE